MSFLTEKMFQLPKRDIQSAEFSQLQTILVRVINGGVSPAEIAQLLSKSYLT
jgi:DNA-binding CsgD family transcriptional regulator